MHPSAGLLAEAMDLIHQEKLALEEEDLARAEELADRRADLLSGAWRLRDGYAGELLAEDLRKMQAMQQHLQDCAEALRVKLGRQISSGRKQTKYFDGYRFVSAMAGKAYYFDKRS